MAKALYVSIILKTLLGIKFSRSEHFQTFFWSDSICYSYTVFTSQSALKFSTALKNHTTELKINFKQFPTVVDIASEFF